MKKLLNRLADSKNPSSLASKLRRKRFAPMLEKIETMHKTLNRPLKILDVGGTQRFWEVMGVASMAYQITLININSSNVSLQNFNSLQGDARDIHIFQDGEFDIVFSNSVIEHVGDWEDQMKMANEVKRLSKYYFVQTPNYYFPIEPHFVFPFLQWLPRNTRVMIVKSLSLGWKKGKLTKEDAAESVDHIKLLKCSEVKKLFPDAIIKRERFLGMTKSFMAIRF